MQSPRRPTRSLLPLSPSPPSPSLSASAAAATSPSTLHTLSRESGDTDMQSHHYIPNSSPRASQQPQQSIQNNDHHHHQQNRPNQQHVTAPRPHYFHPNSSSVLPPPHQQGPYQQQSMKSQAHLVPHMYVANHDVASDRSPLWRDPQYMLQSNIEQQQQQQRASFPPAAASTDGEAISYVMPAQFTSSIPRASSGLPLQATAPQWTPQRPSSMANRPQSASPVNALPLSLLPVQPEVVNGDAANLGPAPLRRGQACRACRRRKLRCDAVRPVCGTCTRSRAAAASANHPSPVPDGDCVYDDGPVSNATPALVSSSPIQTVTASSSGTVANMANSPMPKPQQQQQQQEQHQQHQQRQQPQQLHSQAQRRASASHSSPIMPLLPIHLEQPSFPPSSSFPSAQSQHTQDADDQARSTMKRRKRKTNDERGLAAAGRRSEESKSSASSSVALPTRPVAGETIEEKAARLERAVQYLERLLEKSAIKDGELGSDSSDDAQQTGRSIGKEAAAAAAAGVGTNWSASAKGDKGRRSRANVSTPAIPVSRLLCIQKESGREDKLVLRYPQRSYEKEASASAGRRDVQEVPSSQDLLGLVETEDDKEARIRSEINHLSENALDEPDPIREIFFPGWSIDLPSFDTVLKICETFFDYHPLRPLIYKPAFMSGLRRPPKHPDRPHDSLIHAIIAVTFDISPLFQTASVRVNDKLKGPGDHFILLLGDGKMRAKENETLYPRDNFKNFHLAKARTKVESSLITETRNPLDWILAAILVAYQLWSDARMTEAFFLCATICRSLAPAGLDKLQHRVDDSGPAETGTGLLGLPKGIEEDQRRMALWYCVCMDQIISGSMRFYENCLSEQAVTAHLPKAVADFQAGRPGPPNGQTLASPELFRKGHLDGFNLAVKASILVRRAMTLHCRHMAGDSKHTKPPGLAVIDKSISELLTAFSPSDDYSQPEKLMDRLLAHGTVYQALIHLHEPYLSMTNPTSYSNQRVQMGVRNILHVIRQLMSSDYNFAYLHGQLYIIWSVAGRMLGRRLEYLRAAAGAHVMDGQGGQAVAEREEELRTVTANLDLITSALQRVGGRSQKAKRCYDLLTYLRKGLLTESLLSDLLYTDGVIPAEEAETGQWSNTSIDPLPHQQQQINLSTLSSSSDSNRGDGTSLGTETNPDPILDLSMMMRYPSARDLTSDMPRFDPIAQTQTQGLQHPQHLPVSATDDTANITAAAAAASLYPNTFENHPETVPPGIVSSLDFDTPNPYGSLSHHHHQHHQHDSRRANDVASHASHIHNHTHDPSNMKLEDEHQLHDMMIDPNLRLS